jgi:hypothetical protein
MQPDPLEKFVKANRRAFDDLEPDNKLWFSIEQKLKQSQANHDVPLSDKTKNGLNGHQRNNN